MTAVTLTKDSLEILNHLLDHGPWFSPWNFILLFKEASVFVFTAFKLFFLYFLTFQWVGDLAHIPIVRSQFDLAISQERSFLTQPFFSFLEVPDYSSNKLFLGFLNSFFLSLPFSCTHIITILRLLAQGPLVGFAAGCGLVLGQWWFVTCVVLGLRPFIIPWLTLGPLSYVVGTLLLVHIVYSMFKKGKFLFGENKHKQEIPRNTLQNVFWTSLVLAWTEQSCFFQYLGNVNLGTEGTPLESFFGRNEIMSFLTHGFYSLGLLYGSFFFLCVFGTLIYFTQLRVESKVIELLVKIRGLDMEYAKTWYIKLVYLVKMAFLTLTLSFSFSSIPYYGVPYLLNNPLGSISFENNLTKQHAPRGFESKPEIVAEEDDDLWLKVPRSIIPTFDRPSYYGDKYRHNFETTSYKAERFWEDPSNREEDPFEDESSPLNRGKKKKTVPRLINFISGGKVSEYTAAVRKQQRAKVIRELFSRKDSNVVYPPLRLLKVIPEPFPDEDTDEISEKSFDILKTPNEKSEDELRAEFSQRLEDEDDNETDTLLDEYFQNPTEETLVKALNIFFERYNPYVMPITESSNRKRFLKAWNMGNMGKKFTTELNPEYARDLRDYLNDPLVESDILAGRIPFSGSRAGTSWFQFKWFNPEKLWTREKRSYYDPSYKFSLNRQTKSFLSRQGWNTNLSPLKEVDLFKKRFILAQYYNSIWHPKMDCSLKNSLNPSTINLKAPPSFSSVDNIFNHQFKGTLAVTRRLFLIKPFREEVSRRQIKYDQPLFFSNAENKNLDKKFLHADLQEKMVGRSKTLQEVTDESGTEFLFDPFLKISGSTPFYAGWDTQERKIVLTNRFLSRGKAAFQDFSNESVLAEKNPVYHYFLDRSFDSFDTSSKNLSENLGKSSENIPITSKIEPKNKKYFRKLSKLQTKFSAWPLSESFIRAKLTRNQVHKKWYSDSYKFLNKKIGIPYTVLFRYQENFVDRLENEFSGHYDQPDVLIPEQDEADFLMRKTDQQDFMHYLERQPETIEEEIDEFNENQYVQKKELANRIENTTESSVETSFLDKFRREFPGNNKKNKKLPEWAGLWKSTRKKNKVRWVLELARNLGETYDPRGKSRKTHFSWLDLARKEEYLFQYNVERDYGQQLDDLMDKGEKAIKEREAKEAKNLREGNEEITADWDKDSEEDKEGRKRRRVIRVKEEKERQEKEKEEEEEKEDKREKEEEDEENWEAIREGYEEILADSDKDDFVYILPWSFQGYGWAGKKRIMNEKAPTAF